MSSTRDPLSPPFKNCFLFLFCTCDLWHMAVYIFLFNHLYHEFLLVGFVSWVAWPPNKTVAFLLNSVSISECWTFAPTYWGWWEAEAVFYCICHVAYEVCVNKLTKSHLWWYHLKGHDCVGSCIHLHLLHSNSFRFTSGLVYGLIHWRDSLCCFPVCLFPASLSRLSCLSRQGGNDPCQTVTVVPFSTCPFSFISTPVKSPQKTQMYKIKGIKRQDLCNQVEFTFTFVLCLTEYFILYGAPLVTLDFK